ncbi:MAG: hypothetical protein E6K69_09135 [Nitrospirae bacterium]|nr:MAG: hypothetical protein E6K69_09135 [Nitrospirota bacterium]
MRLTFAVTRWNPETDTHDHEEDYRLEVARGMTVLDALIRIKNEQDGTLSLRYSCRSAICGSCETGLPDVGPEGMGTSRADRGGASPQSPGHQGPGGGHDIFLGQNPRGDPVADDDPTGRDRAGGRSTGPVARKLSIPQRGCLYHVRGLCRSLHDA